MNNKLILNSKLLSKIIIYAVFLLSTSFPFHGFAEGKEEQVDGKKFNVKEIIFEHISDSHTWHIFGKLSIQLPIILYTDKGLEVFSSKKIVSDEEGKDVIYKGSFYSYKLDGNKVIAVDASGKEDLKATSKIFDFSITKNVASMWLAILVLLLVFFKVASSYSKNKGKAPKGLQSLIEPLIVFVRDDVAVPNIGVKYARYMPLLLTVFFFILINNLLGLIPIFPGGYNLTGNIAVTLTLSVIALIVVNFSGNKYYWKHIFAPDIPVWLYIIMVPVEMIGILSRPFALMIRLFANITAGHIIVLSLVSLIFIFNTLWISPVSVLFVVFMDVIELLVAFLQAYIFTMLMSLFIGMAVEEHHH